MIPVRPNDIINNMTLHIGWTKAAKATRDALIAKDEKLRSYFASTYESLKNGEIPLPSSGVKEIAVTFTKYKLVLEIETDRIAKIKLVDITDVK